MDDQQILEHFPELIPYSPHIVGKKIRTYAAKNPFPKELSHNQFRSLNKRAWRLGLDGITIARRLEEPANEI